MTEGDGRDSASWPRFRRTPIVLSGDVPARAAALLTAGVPAGLVGDHYTALEQAAVLAGGDLIAFVEAGGIGRVCLEAGTERIILAAAGDPDDRELINTGLDLFTRSVEAVLVRFPFYADGASPEEIDRVADDIEAALTAIDPPAMAEVGFWYEFVSDVRSGDYTTEELTDPDS